jgi:hypothetical protein
MADTVPFLEDNSDIGLQREELLPTTSAVVYSTGSDLEEGKKVGVTVALGFDERNCSLEPRFQTAFINCSRFLCCILHDPQHYNSKPS